MTQAALPLSTDRGHLSKMTATGRQRRCPEYRDFGIYMRLHEATLDDLIEEGCVLLGSPATVRDQLLATIERYRIGNLHTMLQIGSMPTELARYNIDLFAREVLPHLEGAWADEDWQHHWWPRRLGGASAPQEAHAGVMA